MSLAERLDADGYDIDGWLMLMRSYWFWGVTNRRAGRLPVPAINLPATRQPFHGSNGRL